MLKDMEELYLSDTLYERVLKSSCPNQEETDQKP